MSSFSSSLICGKKERMKVEEMVVRLPHAIREYGWCATLVIVMNMLWHINYHDMVLSSRVVGRTPVPTRADDLFSSRPIFRGWDSSFGFWTSFLIGCTRKEKTVLISWVYWWVSSYGGARITPAEHLEGDVIPSPSYVSSRFHSDWTSLPYVFCWSPSGAWGVVVASEGFLGFLSLSLRCAEDGGSSLASLEVCSKWKGEDLSLKESLFLRRNLLELLSETLDSDVSNEVVPFDGHSREDV